MHVDQCLKIVAHTFFSRFLVAYSRRIFWTVFLLHSQKLISPLSLFNLMRCCCSLCFHEQAGLFQGVVHMLKWTLRQTPPLQSLPVSPCLLQKKCERYWALQQEPLQIGPFCITLVSWGRGGNSTLWSLGFCLSQKILSGKLLGWAWKNEQFPHSPPHTAGSSLVLACK